MNVNPRHSKGQVERLARHYHRRFASSFGSSLEVQDLEQEFWIVWHKVSARFEPERGFAFEALLGRSIKNRAIEMAKFHRRRRDVLSTVSLDYAPSDDIECGTLADAIASDAETGEETLERAQRAERILARIDPRLRQMVETLIDPPEMIQREIEAFEAKCAFAASRGLPRPSGSGVGLGVMTELFNLSRCSRYRLLDQMKEVMKQDD